MEPDLTVQLARLAQIDEAMEALKAEQDKLRQEVLEEIYTAGCKSIGNEFASASIAERKYYDLGDFPEVQELKKQFEAAKKEAEKTAPFVTKPYLVFKRHDVKRSERHGTYVASIISRVEAAR